MDMIQDSHLEAFKTEYLKNLRSLDISSNQITAEGMKILVDC